MRSSMLLPLCFILLTSAALAGPIRVSGSGTFVADSVVSDSSFTISFSGSDGVDSISLNGGCQGWGGTGVACFGQNTGSATIDGLHFGGFGGGIYSFSLGNGTGFASGGNNALGQFASVSLIGYVDATTRSCIGNAVSFVCTGTFQVVPTPEVGSAGPALLGLGVIALRIAKGRIRTGSSGGI